MNIPEGWERDQPLGGGAQNEVYHHVKSRTARYTAGHLRQERLGQERLVGCRKAQEKSLHDAGSFFAKIEQVTTADPEDCPGLMGRPGNEPR